MVRGSGGLPASNKASLWFGALLFLGTLGLFLPYAWNAGFGYDDQAALLENPLVVGSRSPWDAFRQDFWEHRGAAGLYRPFVTLSFWVQADGAATSARPYHLVNVALHGYLVLGWLWLLRDKLLAKPTLWLGLAVFAWHPLQSEAILWIPGRSSSLCALLGSAPLLFWNRVPSGKRWLLAFLGTLGALLVKEDGVAFAAFYTVLLSGRARWTPVAAGACYAAMRVHFLGIERIGSPTAPLLGMGWLERLGIGARVVVWSVTELVWPVGHSLALETRDLSRFPVWRVIVAWAVFSAALAGWVWGRRNSSNPFSPLERASLAGFLVACLPWLQIVPAPELFAPRFLYLPLLFAIPLWGAWKLPRVAVKFLFAVGLVGAWFGVRALAPAYHDALGYWSYRSQHEPWRGEVWNGLGNELAALDLWDQASDAFLAATRCDPRYSRPWVGLGLCAEKRADWSSAEDAYDRALALQPTNPVAMANRARLHSRTGQWEQAQRLYERATQVQPGRAAFWRGLGRCALERNENDTATRALQEALRLDPDDAIARELLDRGLR